MTLRTGLLICLGLLALAGLGLYAALSQSGGVGVPGGKIALEQSLRPYIDASTLRFAQPRIAYNDGQGVVEMTLRTAAFKTKDGVAAVALERISANLDGEQMARGAIRFSTATIERANLTLDLDVLLSKSDAPTPTARALVAAVEEGYRAAFSTLHVEHLSGLTIKTLALRLQSGGEDVAIGEGRLVVKPVGKAMHLSSTLDWRAQGKQQFAGDSNLFIIGGAQHPLEAALTVTAAQIALKNDANDIRIENANIEFSYAHSGAKDAALRGHIKLGALDLLNTPQYDGARRFEALDIHARYDAEDDLLSASVKPFALGTAQASTLAKLSQASGLAQLLVQAQIDALSVQDLKAYWPAFLAKHARLWIAENIDEGRLPVVAFALDAPLKSVVADTMEREALSLTFDISDLKAHYRRPMPPLEKASGSARMSLDDIALTIDSGEINGVDAAGSTVFITSFAQSPQRAEINLRVNGSSTRLAQVLDSEPLGYLSAYEIDPLDLSGNFVGRALLKLPLLKNVLLDDIVLSARVDGQRLSLRGIIEDENLLFRRAVIEVTQDALSMRSDVALDGVGGNLRWREDFTGTSDTPTDIQIAGQIDPTGVARWMPALAGSVFGTVFFDSTLLGRGSDLAKATITADLTPTTISVPTLGYTKEIGQSAEAYASLSSKDGVFAFDALTLKGPDMLVIADGTATQSGARASFSLSAIELPGLKGRLNISKEEDVWLLAGTADMLDASPILDMFWAGSLTQGTTSQTQDVESTLSVSLDLKELGLLNDKRALNTRVLGRFQGSRVRQLNVFGDGPTDAPFTFTIEPIESGRRLLLASQSAGELANGLGMFSTAKGGQLMVQATSFERGDALVIAGLMEMTNIRLLDTPVLAQLLGLGSLSGVADLARNRGINFETVDVPFELSGGVVRVSNASAKGPALGLTANGEFLDSLEKGDIRGVIVPSYTINSALGRVPLIGDVLMGGQDTGLFGINYKISGAMENPELSVNPASVLTPGFLRRIFGNQKGRLEEPSVAPLTPQAAGQTKAVPTPQSVLDQ